MANENRELADIDRNCAICGKECRDGIADFDSGLSAHTHCFFDKQQWLECGKKYTSFIRNNPINNKWYMYNEDNEYKHSEYSIDFCPFCGKSIQEHLD